MAFHILDEVRKRPRNEWNKLFKEQWTKGRIWIQENGEAAFVLGLVFGFLVVIFHKLFIALLALSVVAGCSLYIIAPEGDEVSVKSDTANNSANGNGAGGSADRDSTPKDAASSEERDDSPQIH